MKKQIYQDILRTPDYFWFEPETLEFAGFHLVDGSYQPLEANPQRWLWSQQLQLYLGIYERKLRFFNAEGELVLTTAEYERRQKELAQQQAESERQHKELAQQRAEALATQLRALGIEPDV